MKSAGSPLARALDLGLLAGAWLLVPGDEHAEWWREWRAELWQARSENACEGRVSWASELTLISFCLGAYQDAVCLRRLARNTRPAHRVSFGAAWQCILLLAFLLAASFTLTRMLPGVRAEQQFARISTRSGLVLIQDANNEDSPATIPSGLYRAWKERKQEFFDEVGFYRVTREQVSWQPDRDGTQDYAGWGVAQASSNFFQLVGMPVLSVEAQFSSGMPSMVLSERAWRRKFGANPDVAGSEVQLGSRRAVIVGVVPDGAWDLPGNVDAWLLDPDAKTGPGEVGYVVAHLSSLGQSKMHTTRVQITSYSPRRSPDDLLGISVCRGLPTPGQIFLFALMLALLALPALASVSLSEYSVSFHEISLTQQAYRWGFLVVKFGLLLPAVYFAAIDFGYGFTALGATRALYMQLAASVFGCLFGMCWALSDQRRRCPVCLELVAHPARVGQFSRTFLAWSGTELMCTSGHTLLHVPELPTSWFSNQRWMFLDPSWKFLFANPVRD
jgi:MacB-like periplasmic core domain